MQPTKVSQPRTEKSNAMHLSQDRRFSCTQHFDWGMTQLYHLEVMQLCFLNIQISEVRCFCVTLFGPTWCMMSCSTLTCHLHGVASLTCPACIFTNLPRSTIHMQDILPSKRVGLHLYSHTPIQVVLQMLILPGCAQSILVSLYCTFDILVWIHVNFTKMICRGCTGGPSLSSGWPSSAVAI